MRVTIVAIVLAVSLVAGCVTTGGETKRNKSSPTEAAQINYELGSQYLRQGDLKLARERLERSVSQDPNLPGPHIALALLFEQTGESERANSAYKRALKISPNNANALNSYAVFLCKRRDYETGQAMFLRAANTPGNRAPEVALANAGVCALEKPDMVMAEQHFRQALQRNPKFADALLQMAVLSLSRDDAFRARAFLARYEDEYPMTAETLLLGVRIEKVGGDGDALSRYAEKLRSEFPMSRQARSLDGVINGG